MSRPKTGSRINRSKGLPVKRRGFDFFGHARLWKRRKKDGRGTGECEGMRRDVKEWEGMRRNAKECNKEYGEVSVIKC